MSDILKRKLDSVIEDNDMLWIQLRAERANLSACRVIINRLGGCACDTCLEFELQALAALEAPEAET